MKNRAGDFLLDEDVKLMLEFKGGDNSAFEKILDKYHIPIINFIYRLIGDKSESEDLAQEVFLRVYRSSQNYIPKAKFSTYIYKISKNLALNELRRRDSQKLSFLEEIAVVKEGEILPRQISNDKLSVSKEIERKDLIEVVKKAIETLPEKQRIAVILRRYEGFSYEEIAKIMSCSISAVKSLLNRAKLTLKDKLFFYVVPK